MKTRVKISALLIAVLAACSKPVATFPGTIDFAGETLTKLAAGNEQHLSAITYARRGETLPSASITVGVIVRDDYTKAGDMMYWLTGEYIRSGVIRLHESTQNDESCKAGVSDAGTPAVRPFVHGPAGLQGGNRADRVRRSRRITRR